MKTILIDGNGGSSVQEGKNAIQTPREKCVVTCCGAHKADAGYFNPDDILRIYILIFSTQLSNRSRAEKENVITSDNLALEFQKSFNAATRRRRLTMKFQPHSIFLASSKKFPWLFGSISNN